MASVAVTAKRHTPSGYRPGTQLAQWMNLIPNAPADSHNKVFVMFKGQDSFEFLLQKGITHFSNYDLVQATPEQLEQLQNVEGRAYDQAPKTPAQFNLGTDNVQNAVWVRPADKPDEYPWNMFPWIWNKLIFLTDDNALVPMTPEQGTAAGMAYTTARNIVVFENGENVHAVGQQWPFRRSYYQAFIPRMQAYWDAKGKPFYVADNYLSNGGKTLYFFSNAAEAKAYASKPVSQWDFSELHPGGTLELTNTWCFPIYLNALDLNPRVALNLIYNGFLAHKAGKYLLVFMQGFLEWKPNNFEEVKYQDGSGTLYKKSKLPHTITQAYNYSFLAQEHTDGFIPFSMDSKTIKPFQFLSLYHQDGSIYYQEGSTVPVNSNLFPHWLAYSEEKGGERFPSNGVGDFVGFGKAAFDATFWHVHGGTEHYCRFSVDNGPWVEVSNVDMNDIADAEYQKRGFVYTKKLGNKLAFYWLNVYADINLHVVRFEHAQVPGITFVLNVHSSIIHAGLIDVSQIVLP